MSVSFVARGHIAGRVVMAFEMCDLRDYQLNRDFDFTSAVDRHEIRHYELDANGELVLRLVIGLGYDGEYLREVIVYVTKVGADVPNVHVGASEDIVESVVRLSIMCRAWIEYVWWIAVDLVKTAVLSFVKSLAEHGYVLAV
ncbi:hypothetical protein CBR_g74632 [Chara braunii]|uniref:Uncharacterized protein n=1 Tax=Chara braunii TaxID=69332 RepID=A0A388KA59_CHABU|nr:hypothetical protein CBR_g74632 [Chara braunii]|eukprot:GBG66945.1 hypothetical protein CBR_g74632 [Chara braunii]